MVHLGFDPIWFGILIVVVVEIGLISPPVGMILFLMHSLHPEIPMTTIYRGVMPFVLRHDRHACGLDCISRDFAGPAKNDFRRALKAVRITARMQASHRAVMR